MRTRVLNGSGRSKGIEGAVYIHLKNSHVLRTFFLRTMSCGYRKWAIGDLDVAGGERKAGVSMTAEVCLSSEVPRNP